MPPMICANCDTASGFNDATNSLPKNNATIIMNVSGICPLLIFAKELSNINIKTMPLAPSNPVFVKKMAMIPVINAVITIIISIVDEPYFSSSNGPINNIKVRFPKRCSHETCPSTCVNILT